MATLRILQLTDLHVFAEPHTLLKGIPTRESLQDVISHIRQHEAAFEHLIVTGDHTHDELPESYAAVRELLSPWNEQLWQVPGNHDDRAVLRSIFPQRESDVADARINFEFTAGDWLFLGLDTHLPGQVAGIMDADQIDWLRARLHASEADRVALFQHHPPSDVNSTWMDAIGLGGRELLQDVIRDDERIRLVCCGHVHHEFHTTIGRADVFSTPSTGVQFDPAGAVPKFAAAAPGYRVIEISGGEFTTYVGRLPEVRYIPVNE